MLVAMNMPVATVRMHAHAWVLCEAAPCAARSACKLIAQHALSVAEHACIKSTYMQPFVGFVCVIKNGFRHCLLMRKLYSWSC